MTLALTVKLTFYTFYSQNELKYPKALLSSFFFYIFLKAIIMLGICQNNKYVKLTRASSDNNLLLHSSLQSCYFCFSGANASYVLRLYENSAAYEVHSLYRIYAAHLSNNCYLICIRLQLLEATFPFLSQPTVISSLTGG